MPCRRKQGGIILSFGQTHNLQTKFAGWTEITADKPRGPLSPESTEKLLRFSESFA